MKLFSIRAKLSHYQVFRKKIISEKDEKAQILINQLVYLGLSILDLSKSVMYEFWYDYVKPIYGENEKFCYMDTGSFFDVKTDDTCKDIAEDVETGFEILNFEIDRPLPKEKNIN